MICEKCGKKIAADTISCWSCGFTNAPPDESKERPKWFLWFLYGLIALSVLLIINNIGALVMNEHGTDLLTFEIYTLIFQTALYVIEICLYILFIFKMKRKLLIGYFAFLIISSLFSIFTGSIVLLVRYLPIYWIFQSQWDKFKK